MYTIRNISPQLDQLLHKRAAQTGKSFNATVVEALNNDAFGQAEPPTEDPFDALFGASTLDEGFDKAIADQSRIDPELWK